MSEKDRKREAAMRLFGALSGVDEEYLAGCEADAGKATAGQELIPFERLGLFMRKYGTAVAAVLCVAVLGVSLAGYRLSGRGTAGGTQNGSMAFLQDNASGATINDEYEAAEEIRDASTDEVNSIAKTGGTTTNGGNDNGSNNSTANDLTSEETGQDGLQEQQAEAFDERLKDDLQRMEADRNLYANKNLTLEEARQVSVVGAYLPAVFPESGGIDALTAINDEGQERIQLGWNTDEKDVSEGWFYLTIENLGNSLPDWLEHNTVFEEEQITKANIEECMAAGPADAADSRTPGGALSVLYENQGSYVLLTIWGEISSEEVWKMLK